MRHARRDERRAARRVRLRIDAAYEDSQSQIFLRTYDISERGVFLLTREPPAPGAAANLLLELPGHPALLRLRGTVARCGEQPGPGFAVAFDRRSLSHEARAALRRFVEREQAGANAG